jgi:hypothetical protein
MQNQQTTIEELFPGLKPEEHDEARQALRRYLSFIVRLHARITADPGEGERLAALTQACRAGRMDSGRTFTNQYSGTDV